MIKVSIKRNFHPGNEEGIVLLVVLLILSLLSVLFLSWGKQWATELKLTANFRETNQCRRLAEAGVYYALGKLVAARAARKDHLAGISSLPQETDSYPAEIWKGDNDVHVLDLPEGRVRVRIEDEGGKINLNSAPGPVMSRLFKALGLPEMRVRIMVDSLLDWRNRSDHPRPYGAKSEYYLRLDPPYVAKNGPFEEVEELAWVRGFEDGALIPRLGELLTVQSTGNAVNINTAPLEVLQAMGFTKENAAIIIDRRKTKPINGVAEIGKLISNPLIGQELGISFRPSPYVTIISQGTKKSGGRYNVKTVVRLNVNNKLTPWKILSWIDDFPE